MPQPDRIADLFAPWREERPDLDVDTMVSAGRLLAAGRAMEAAVEANARAYGQSPADGDVLLTLRRARAPYLRSPSELAAALLTPSGTLTGRLDRLERAGLIERVPDPSDRRAMKVRLTAEGLALTDEAMASHVEAEEQVLSALSARERDQLDRLLRKLLAGVDGHLG